MGQGITNSILTMLIIMLCMNIGLAFTQTAVTSLGSDATVLNASNSPITNYHTGTLNTGVSTVTTDLLPSDEAEVGDTGNIFTDTYTAMKSYITTGLESLGFLGNMLSQPAGFLRTVGVDPAICLALQIIWSIVFIFLITAWIFGRT